MPQLLIHSETGETSYLALADDITNIGRRSDNDLCLPEVSVSGYHARITNTNGCVIIEDASSTNGTWVNGEKIDRYILVHLDDISIGGYTMSYSETYAVTLADIESNNVAPLEEILPIVDPAYTPAIDQKAVIRVASGKKAGSVMMLEKAVTTVGKPGGDLGAIAKKPTGYYFVQVNDNEASMKHNGEELGPLVEVKLAGGDVIEIGGEQLEFIHPY